MSEKTTLWTYFKKIDKESAKCTLCSKILKMSSRSTKGLHLHLKSKHTIDMKEIVALQESQAKSSTSTSSSQSFTPVMEPRPSTSTQSDLMPSIQDETLTSSKKRKIDNYFLKDITMDKIIARMVAKDGLAFSLFCTSTDIR